MCKTGKTSIFSKFAKLSQFAKLSLYFNHDQIFNISIKFSL